MSIGERIANRALGSFMVGGSEHAALVITTTGSMARIRRINSTRHEFTIARTGEISAIQNGVGTSRHAQIFKMVLFQAFKLAGSEDERRTST